MHYRSRLSLLIAFIVFSGALAALAEPQAQPLLVGGVGLTLFGDRNFRGRTATLRDDAPNLTLINMNDVARSLQVGRGERWEVCEHINFGGRCIVVSESVADLSRNRFDRIISSARRISGGGGRGGGRGTPGPGPGSFGLELFSRTGFGGERRGFLVADPDLRRIGFNDAAQSLRVLRGQTWEVCVDSNFRNCRTVTGDVPDLGRMNMSRRISSVRQRPR